MEKNVPRANLPDVCRGALVEKVAHLLQLAPSRARIVQQVAQLRRIGLDLSIVLCELGIALEHQHLMLWPTRLPRGVHGWLSRRVGVGGQRGHSRERRDRRAARRQAWSATRAGGHAVFGNPASVCKDKGSRGAGGRECTCRGDLLGLGGAYEYTGMDGHDMGNVVSHQPCAAAKLHEIVIAQTLDPSTTHYTSQSPSHRRDVSSLGWLTIARRFETLSARPLPFPIPELLCPSHPQLRRLRQNARRFGQAYCSRGSTLPLPLLISGLISSTVLYCCNSLYLTVAPSGAYRAQTPGNDGIYRSNTLHAGWLAHTHLTKRPLRKNYSSMHSHLSYSTCSFSTSSCVLGPSSDLPRAVVRTPFSFLGSFLGSSSTTLSVYFFDVFSTFPCFVIEIKFFAVFGFGRGPMSAPFCCPRARWSTSASFLD